MKWKTWIGNNWNSLPQDGRLMVIGESHYSGGDNADFARENVEDASNGRFYKRSPFFPFVARCISGEESPDFKIFDNIAYNVIVQRALESSAKKHRPNKEDFKDGWLSVFKEIKRLEVKQCLFIGVEAANHFNYACKPTFKKDEYGLKYFDKIKGCRPRIGFIKNDEFDVKFTFIRHAGRGGWKYWMEWSHYLNELGIRI